jgi:hypothetical protein
VEEIPARTVPMGEGTVRAGAWSGLPKRRLGEITDRRAGDHRGVYLHRRRSHARHAGVQARRLRDSCNRSGRAGTGDPVPGSAENLRQEQQ